VTATAALLSLSDRQGLDRLAAALRSRGFKLYATSGTAAAIRELGLECEDVASITGFPPLCDGRVKTLHPKIFAGILARRAEPRNLVAGDHELDLHRTGPLRSVRARTIPPLPSLGICRRQTGWAVASS